jgi:hypothetical protein
MGCINFHVNHSEFSSCPDPQYSPNDRFFEEKLMKVFEVFGHSVVPGITEFWNESNKIISEHTAAKFC